MNRRPRDLMLQMTTRHDIFLSHAIVDKDAVAKAHARITAEGYSVYIDWMVDDDLERRAADRRTADRLRQRMKHAATMFYAVSAQSKQSRWMPWELGYADAWAGRVFIYPLDAEAGDYARNMEFLSLYEVVDTDNLAAFLRANVPKAAVEQIGPGAHEVTAVHADKVIEAMPRLLTDPEAAMRYQMQFWKAWWAMMGVRM